MKAASLRELLRGHWLMGALAGAPLLLALAPLLAFPAWLFWVFLQQPIYMVHQLEEHIGDRFRRFVNERLAGGKEALTPAAVAVINIGGVWTVNAASLLLAGLWHPGFALVAAWLTVVNAVTHIAASVKFRGYNPGLVTSVVLFLPAGITALVLVSREPRVGVAAHLGALLAIVALHAAIILHVKRRL